jgi:hypothetical protein
MTQALIKRDVIVLGASTGGVQALLDLCKKLPPDLPPSSASSFTAVRGTESTPVRCTATEPKSGSAKASPVKN